jgi:hypothetical protein
VPSERTEERLERLLDHGRERPKRMFHGGVSGMSCTYCNLLPKLSAPGADQMY